MANYEVLEPGGHAALIDGLKDYTDREGGVGAEQIADGSVNLDKLDEDVLDVLDTKADIDGYYAQLTAGAADNLTARGDAVEASFIRRTSGGVNDIESGNATIKSIKGNTIRWNQLAPSPFGDSNTLNGVTFAKSGDGMTMKGTATSTVYKPIKNNTKTVVGHTYFVKIIGTGLTNVRVYNDGGGVSVNAANGSGIGVANAAKVWYLRIENGTEIDGFVIVNIFDLTVMFGAGNEPETVAEFEALYPEPYYAYDAGSLLPVTMTGIATDGFNQLDLSNRTTEIQPTYNVASVRQMGENLLYKGIRTTNEGVPQNVTYSKTSDGYIVTSAQGGYGLGLPVRTFPNTEYYVCHAGSTGGVRTAFYTEDGVYISGSGGNETARTFTTPANCHWTMLILAPSATNTATTFTNICINLSWSGRRNGEYEPYWSAQRAIDISTYFPTGLKKADTVYDELTGTEAITRVGVVDLGTLTWQYFSNYAYFRASLDRINESDLVCSKYQYGGVLFDSQMNSAENGVYSPRNASFVYVKDTSYTDAAAFKTAMSGVMLYYVLATPIVTPIDSINLTYKVDDWGTETITGPLGAAPDMDIIYGMNAVDTIRRLPDLYAGKAETEAALAGKADVDGYYSQMTVGAADNLTGRGDTTTAEFLYRTAGGTADIETGQAVAKSVKGNTLVWNQIAKPRSSYTDNGLTFTNNGDGSISVSGTATSTAYLNVTSNIQYYAGHKYIHNAGFAVSGSWKTPIESSTSGKLRLRESLVDGGYGMMISVTEGETYDTTYWPCMYDITVMFGAGNEPMVDEFEAWFPLPHYEYDAGSLLSVNMEGIETVGFNQLDPAKVAALNGVTENTGVFSGNTSTIRGSMFTVGWEGVDYIPGMQYEASFKIETSTAANVNARPYFTYTDGTTSDGVIVAAGGTAYAISTAGKTISHVGLNFGNNGTLVFSQPCIHLVWSGRRNGEYEPFWSSQREIAANTYFPDGMRSAGSVRDELTSTEVITRVGAVDLGTLTWTANTDGTDGKYKSSRVADIMHTGLTNASVPRAECAKYTPRVYFSDRVTDAYDVDKSIGFVYSEATSTGTQVFVYDSAYTTAAALKAALSGVMLYYELATPTVTPIDPALNLSYRVDDFGTERVMVPEDERSAPPVLDIAYGLNVVDFVRRAPSEYMSHASMSQFRLALMSHFGIFINETWDEVDNRYEYTITSE